MTSKRPFFLALALAAAGSLAYAALTRASGGPLDAVPADSYLVATVDVAGLRASPLYAFLFEKDRTWGLGDLALACGFDPLTRIQELDIAIPETGEPGDFGVAASAEVTREELVVCAENIAGARGEPHRAETVGRFHMLENQKGHALAVHENGPILVGRAAMVRAMIAASEKRARGVRSNAEHMALRTALVPPGVKALVVATALLPKDLRDRLKGEMGAELGVDGSNAAFAGVLGVSAAGLSVRATEDGMLEARAELHCESETACAEVKKLALAKRLLWSQDLALRVVGLGALIDALEVDAQGKVLTAKTRARVADLSSTLERIQKLRGRVASPRPKESHQAPIRPDEVLRAKDASR